MKSSKKRIKNAIITNSILAVILIAVFTIGFLPEKIVPIYSNYEESAIYNGNREKRQVSLMFNVYENTDVVNGIIDLLDKEGVKATFFVGGCWADDNQKTLERIVGCGHEIGNHGYFHKDHKKLNYEKNREEINLTGVIVKALCGVQPTLFAPPSGSFSSVTLEASTELGYKTIMWSKDTIDWRDSEVAMIVRRATENLSNGDLILMHPKPHTLEALPEIIKVYKQQNFKIVTVSENIKDI